MSESQSDASRHDDDGVPQQVQVLEISQTEVPQGLTDDMQMQVRRADKIYMYVRFYTWHKINFFALWEHKPRCKKNLWDFTF